jgi:hypothetical protein
MRENSMLEQIKRGDPKAIATLMSRLLQPQGITVRVNRKGDVLIVLLEAADLPDPGRMVQFIQTGMANLNIPSVRQIQLYGKQTDQATPAWNRTLVLSRSTVSKEQKEQGEQRAIASSPSASSVPPSSSAISTTTGKMLTASLWLRIGFDALFILYSLAWATYYIYYFLDIADPTGFWTYFIDQLVQTIGRFFVPLERIANGVYWATALFMLVWLHRFHAKLKILLGHYPISPWGAVARFAIPFYNFWGIWNLFTTLPKQLERANVGQVDARKQLRRWLPIFYGSFIASNVLRQAYWVHIEPTPSPSELAIWLYVLRNGAALLLAIAWFKLVRGAIRAIQ